MKPYQSKTWLQGQRAAGHSIAHISRLAGVTPATISIWLRRHGLAGPAPDTTPVPFREELGDGFETWLRESYESGMSLYDIAAEANCNHSTVVNWLTKYDIPQRSHIEATTSAEFREKMSQVAKSSEYREKMSQVARDAWARGAHADHGEKIKAQAKERGPYTMPLPPEDKIPGYYSTLQAATLLSISRQRVSAIAKRDHWLTRRVGRSHLYAADDVQRTQTKMAAQRAWAILGISRRNWAAWWLADVDEIGTLPCPDCGGAAYTPAGDTKWTGHAACPTCGWKRETS